MTYRCLALRRSVQGAYQLPGRPAACPAGQSGRSEHFWCSARSPFPAARPADAEELLRSCGVRGDSRAIQDYLTKNCDCHPLVIGVLAGLINDYFKDRGRFDVWADDPTGGGQLNLADLNLIQRPITSSKRASTRFR